MFHINVELKSRFFFFITYYIFYFYFFVFVFYLFESFSLSGDFSDGQTNNLVNTQTNTDSDLHRNPLLTTSQSVPTESRVFLKAEYGGLGWWCLIKFLGLSNCLSWTSERLVHYTHCN